MNHLTKISQILFLMSFLILFQPITEAQQKENFKVAIFLYPRVELLDFAGPGEVFAATPGFQTYLVTVDGKSIQSQGFVTVTPNYSMEDAPIPDIVIFPGWRS